MPLLRELGSAVRQRRRDIGLSQQQVADLAELSRATVSDLENGRLKDLSSSRIERLANELGFAVGLVRTRHPGKESALKAAARVASVPYTNDLPPSVLAESLGDGIVPPGYIPQLRTWLEEAPVAMLADVAEELSKARGVSRSETWKRMRTLAGVLKSNRRLWQCTPT